MLRGSWGAGTALGQSFRPGVAAASKNRKPGIFRKPRVGEGKLALHERRAPVGCDHARMHAIAAESGIVAGNSRWHTPGVMHSHEIKSDQS